MSSSYLRTCISRRRCRAYWGGIFVVRGHKPHLSTPLGQVVSDTGKIGENVRQSPLVDQTVGGVPQQWGYLIARDWVTGRSALGNRCHRLMVSSPWLLNSNVMRVNVVGLMYSPAPYKRIAHAYVNWATRGRRVLKRLPFGACGGFDND